MSAKLRIQGLSSSGSILFEKGQPRHKHVKMSIPRAHIEMHRGGDDGNPPLIVKQPVMLEPTELRAGGLRPHKVFAALGDTARGHIVAMIGEYLGTTMFLFFGFIAAQTANEKKDITLRASIGAAGAPEGPSLLQISYISAVFGLSLAANAWIWYRVSGGMFNPSVSHDRIWGRGQDYIPSLMAGGRSLLDYGSQAPSTGSASSVLFQLNSSGGSQLPAWYLLYSQVRSKLRILSAMVSAQEVAS